MLEARIRKLPASGCAPPWSSSTTRTTHVGAGSIVEIADEPGEMMEVTISAVGGVSPDSPLGRR